MRRHHHYDPKKQHMEIKYTASESGYTQVIEHPKTGKENRRSIQNSKEDPGQSKHITKNSSMEKEKATMHPSDSETVLLENVGEVATPNLERAVVAPLASNLAVHNKNNSTQQNNITSIKNNMISSTTINSTPVSVVPSTPTNAVYQELRKVTWVTVIRHTPKRTTAP